MNTDKVTYSMRVMSAYKTSARRREKNSHRTCRKKLIDEEN